MSCINNTLLYMFNKNHLIQYINTFLSINFRSSTLSAVEAERCQVRRLLCSMQWLHSDCLRVQHDVGEDLACTIWTWVERWQPWAVHRDRWPHRMSLPQLGAHMDAIEAASKPESSWVWHGGIDCLQELKMRPTYTTLSGLKWAAGHMLVAFSALQQRPYAALWQL